MKITVYLSVAALLMSGVALASFQSAHQNDQPAVVSPQSPLQKQEKKRRLEAMQKDITLAINEIRLAKNLPEVELKT